VHWPKDAYHVRGAAAVANAAQQPVRLQARRVHGT
jgi:hypothetical protein